ncbi:MAG: hypothetical protein ACE5Q6_11950 [Dehalococcoidia bacterium]
MLNLLVSWPYLGKEILQLVAEHHDQIRLLLDSGAFTNWKRGEDTKVPDYIDFIRNLPIEPWRYFALDRIGDPENTRSNLRRMLDAGLNPVPVFTRGSPAGLLEELYTVSDLVGIGVGVGSSGYLGYIRWISEQLRGRNAHWLGVTNPALVAYYRPYSCDCSNWETGARYGSIPLYLGSGRFTQYHRRDAASGRPTTKVWKIVRSYGFDPNALQHESSWRGGKSVIRSLGASSWVRYSLEAEARFGTKVFLALTTSMACKLVIEAYQKELTLRDAKTVSITR